MSARQLIVLVIAAIAAGWFGRGCSIEDDIQDRLNAAPPTVERHETKKPVPLPELPLQTKPVKPKIKKEIDTAAITSAIDSMKAIYGDSLSVLRELFQEREYEYGHPDSSFYLRLTAMTPRAPVITQLKISPVKCDSVVVTKYIPVEVENPWYDHWYVGAIGTIALVFGASQL